MIHPRPRVVGRGHTPLLLRILNLGIVFLDFSSKGRRSPPLKMSFYTYLEEVHAVFPDAAIKGKMIVAYPHTERL